MKKILYFLTLFFLINFISSSNRFLQNKNDFGEEDLIPDTTLEECKRNCEILLNNCIKLYLSQDMNLTKEEAHEICFNIINPTRTTCDFKCVLKYQHFKEE